MVHGFINFVEHMQDDTVNGMEQAVKEFAVFQKERAQCFIYGKNTVPVQDINQFEGHVSSPFHCIFIAAGRTKTGMAAEHFVNVFHFTVTCVDKIFNFLIIVAKNFF